MSGEHIKSNPVTAMVTGFQMHDFFIWSLDPLPHLVLSGAKII
jgi:hypothetical protein